MHSCASRSQVKREYLSGIFLLSLSLSLPSSYQRVLFPTASNAFIRSSSNASFYLPPVSFCLELFFLEQRLEICNFFSKNLLPVWIDVFKRRSFIRSTRTNRSKRRIDSTDPFARISFISSPRNEQSPPSKKKKKGISPNSRNNSKKFFLGVHSSSDESSLQISPKLYFIFLGNESYFVT